MRRPGLIVLLLLLPPMLWLAIGYLGSLFALFAQSFFSYDDFSGVVKRDFTLATYRQLLEPANFDSIWRTLLMALAVTVACATIALPIATYVALYARPRIKGLLFVGVLLPLWSSYLVRVYAWKLILAKEGIIGWLADSLGVTWAIDSLLAIPGIGGPSLSTAYIGTFIVFVYIWLPYAILPVIAALERVPASLIEASADLGATPSRTYRAVILPLIIPGIAAGSIFTFSLTLGDYIIPGIIGPTPLVIGQQVLAQCCTAGNLPLAAAFSVAPLLILIVYLFLMRRLGAFDAL